jgi:Fe-S cluster assembly protein SufD
LYILLADIASAKHLIGWSFLVYAFLRTIFLFCRYAQQTDAGQLTRSLLLEPRATVNVKPNLQIIADDVKCSHGAAISDLEETQLFYFQARGIDLETARKALVFSFGAEVIEKLPNSFIRKQVENHVKGLLDSSFKGSSH